MPPRSLTLFDLPLLARYRDDLLVLDSTYLLTQGHPLQGLGLLRHLHPTQHLHSSILLNQNRPLLGGVIHLPNESFARLLYLTPTAHLTPPGVLALIEHLATQAGSWGTFHLLAEVEESHAIFPLLRSAGFSVYAWQRMWQLPSEPSVSSSGWRRAGVADWTTVHSLYIQIVPPLLQAVESMPRRRDGLLRGQRLLSYAGLVRGWAGTVILPFIPPEAEEAVTSLVTLAGELSRRGRRPVYVRVRSYQAWLEPMLEDLGARAGPRKAVMVKHLAHWIKEEQPASAAHPRTASIQPSTMVDRV